MKGRRRFNLGVIEEETEGKLGRVKKTVSKRPDLRYTDIDYNNEIFQLIMNSEVELSVDLICLTQDILHETDLKITRIINVRPTYNTCILEISNKFCMKCLSTVEEKDLKTLVQSEAGVYNIIKKNKIDNLFPIHHAHGRMYASLHDKYYEWEVIVMELLGQNLWDLSSQKDLDALPQAVGLLETIHEKNLCHGDSKLDNFALSSDRRTIKMIDPARLEILDETNTHKHLFFKLRDLNQFLISWPQITGLFQSNLNNLPMDALRSRLSDIKQAVDENMKSFFVWDIILFDDVVTIYYPDSTMPGYSRNLDYVNKNSASIDMDLIYGTLKNKDYLLPILNGLTLQFHKLVTGDKSIDDRDKFYLINDKIGPAKIQPVPNNSPQPRPSQVPQYIVVDLYGLHIYMHLLVNTNNAPVVDRLGTFIYGGVDPRTNTFWYYNTRVQRASPDFNTVVNI